MRMRWSTGWFLVLLLGLSGCRSQVATTEDGAAVEDTTTHLGTQIDISLTNWLDLPRPELAKLVEDWTGMVSKQREEARGQIEGVQLLPQLRPPVLSAGFAEAKFSPAAGFSLPPYLAPGKKDAAVALHLARFGDGEAARKLADAADKDLLAKIEGYRSERNYPIEWTCLVALVLQHAELKLANGEVDGATELVLLHRELRSLLDGNAASGTPLAPQALSATLLPRGRQALTLAAAAWREPSWNKTALSTDIDAALADWGATPDLVPGLKVGAKRSEVTALIGKEGQGRTVLAQTPEAIQRAIDLLAVPVPSEGVSGIAAFLDSKDTLTNVFVVYRPKLNELFPEPRHLALGLLERGYASENPTASPGMSRQVWTGGESSYKVAVLTRGTIGGAMIRIGRKDDPAATASEGKPAQDHGNGFFARNPRDFGAVNLDRSFEQNRLGLAPNQTGKTLEVKDSAKLVAVTPPASQHALEAAVLTCEPKEDLLARLALRWPADQNPNALSQLVLPFWAAYGYAPLESVEDSNGGNFALKWQNETTRVQLRLPFDEHSPELLVEDSRGPDALKARVEAAAAFDRREREQRLATGKPREYLARFIQLPSHGIDNLKLGLTREQVQAALPGTQSIRVQPLANDGLNILFLNEPPLTATYWPRQLFVRFDSSNRVAEIRVRYQEGPHAPGPKNPGLLDKLRARNNGAPESLPAPWVGLWTDLPARKAPVFYRWLDDITCLTYQRDSGGSEVVLRDCPVDQPQGVALPPLLFCGRGVEACSLGDTRNEVRKRWQIRNPIFASNGAEVVPLPASSPYDVLLVWYENDRVSRVIARHRTPTTLKNTEVTAALQKAWGADLDHLGYVRRQDGVWGQIVQAYSYHDDRTRVRLFAQETPEGIRVFTAWREWPIPAQTVASK